MKALPCALALASLMVLTACNSVKGTMEVSKRFTSITAKGKSVTFQPGKFAASLKLKSESEAQLEIAYPTKDDKVKLSFVLPEGEKFPQYAGDVEMSAKELGQAYDMKGHVATKESDTERRRGNETCTYQVMEPVCGPNGCHYENVTRNGWQQVEYYFHDEDTSFDVGLFTPNRAERLARFAGTSRTSQKIYTYQGRCF